MIPSTCISEDKLAAYLDGELQAEARSAVARHIGDCVRCRQVIEDMHLVGRAMRSLPTVDMPEAVADRIQTARFAGSHGLSVARRDSMAADGPPAADDAMPAGDRPAANRGWRWNRGRRAAAASIAVLLMLAAILSRNSPTGSGGYDATLPVLAASAPFNLGPVLEALDHAGRLPSLPTGYKRSPVSAEGALRRVAGQIELNWAAVPADLTLEAASVIEYDHFQMAQLVFTHAGGTVVLYVKPRGYTISFAHHPAEPTRMGRRRCIEVRCGNYRAYCFRTSEALYTVIGRYDDPMLDALYSAIQG